MNAFLRTAFGLTRALCLTFALRIHAADALTPIDLAKPPAGIERIEVFVLSGQSNMKGRGLVPTEQSPNPHIAMMHLRNDQWYVARHPVHDVGDPVTQAGSDNAGVGPGLAFAEAVAAQDPHVLVALVPCAVGGSRLNRWVKGARFYGEAVRRMRLALGLKSTVPVVLGGVLWLQGEADARANLQPTYEARLTHMIDDLRADLASPHLPFIAATIGEFGKGGKPRSQDYKSLINATLLALPNLRPGTACVDARDLQGQIGDNVHYDTVSANEIGTRMAAKYAAVKSSAE